MVVLDVIKCMQDQIKMMSKLRYFPVIGSNLLNFSRSVEWKVLCATDQDNIIS